MMDERYLWQRTGSDPDVERLEALLGSFRTAAAVPDFRSELARLRFRHNVRRMAWAAAILLTLVALVVARAYATRNRWEVREIAGTVFLPPRGELKAGQTIRTATRSTARLASSAVGVVDVAENTTVSLVENRAGRHVLELKVGTVHAKTTSPPGVFVVETPSAKAIDLGCEYTLTVRPDGGGALRVQAGWVELTPGFSQALVPAGAAADVDDAGHLTPPYFEDASLPFKAAVRRYAFSLYGDPVRAPALKTILELARVRDSLTLLNLFVRGTTEERFAVWDRLNQLVPAPPTIPRQAMASWDMRTDADWWPLVFKATGVQAIKKKKGPLGIR